ncbi:hypothetical protein GFS24_01285 [Chitinophaga sp. SYP-B3965]|uniref:erythromycin esterase family protein n=1 Tax=Chitinophaga sp. SYP-B3965 TaxID=2663120 RepID=UPI00129A0687|nr:erythromycin esterase family protein [Chitinophaga sp. SYP-B3965]MRG43722.1 hypothetical protein [Chitinophaga sp. SYP-B3965]
MLRIFIALTLLGCHAYGQTDMKTYAEKNTVPVTTVDPSITDYKDLKVIGDAIGDARIVMLGEQDHGDAPAFLAKSRLIKYLHEQKGFTVLAFESDFFALNEGWDGLVKSKDSIIPFLKMNMYPIWSMCTSCSSLLYEYVPATFQTPHPLQISGFDSQALSTYAARKMRVKLDSVLRFYQLPITRQPEYDSTLFKLFSQLYQSTSGSNKDTSGHVKRHHYLVEIRRQLQEKVTPTDFWLMMMNNLIRQNEQYQYIASDRYRAMNARDAQMARNLAWLADVKYPGQKIIVWAHNYHISKYAGHYPESFLNNIAPMGHVFTQELQRMKDTYILGFTSWQGTAGRLGLKTYKVQEPGKKTLESWINPDYEQAFLDFQAYNESRGEEVESFLMAGSLKGNMFHSVHKAMWSKVFDGVFYIKTMYACEGMK